MFEAALHLHEPWWRRIVSHSETSYFLQHFLGGLIFLAAFDHLYLWAFEVYPELYFDPNLSGFQRFLLQIFAWPGLQAFLGLVGLFAFYILGTSSNYRRLLMAWGLASMVFLSDALVLSVERFRLGAMTFLAMSFLLPFIAWRLSVSKKPLGPIYGPRQRPLSSAKRLRLLAYLILLQLALSWYINEFRRPDNLSESAPFIGQRMINRRGAWLVERFTLESEAKPYPTKRIFFHRDGYCLTESPSRNTFGRFETQSGKLSIRCLPLGPSEVAYAFEADRLHLTAPGFSLTLRQDSWGPGTYADIFPFLSR